MRPMTLAAARVDAGYTQSEVARIMQVSKNTIVSWEKGTREPKVTQAIKLCELYNRPSDDIIFAHESN